MTRRGMTRRELLARIGATGAAASAGLLWDPVRAAAAGTAQVAAVVDPSGTTLELSIRRPEGSGYVSLVEGPGYPQVQREDLAAAQEGREARRVPLAAIVHLTDIHVIDAESPARVEFTDQVPGPFSSAHRPQETMTVQVGAAMVDRVRSVASGPVTGRRFDVAVSTGDNVDNQQRNELEWFLALMDGGPVTPDSGGAGYEGVQDDTVGLGYYNSYWHPDPPPGSNPTDSYKALHGFPELPGLLDAVVAPLEAAGLDIPWYSTYGNHDGLVQGNVPGELPGVPPASNPFDPVLTGPLKVVAVATSFDPSDLSSALTSLPGLLDDPGGTGAVVRAVTPDPQRRAVTVAEWIQAHLDSPSAPGPSGHGYTEEMLATRQLYYSFPISDAVLGISLDTVNHGGYADGSIGDAQLAWLEQQLVAVHSTHYDAAGTKVTTDHSDRLVVLFSHHNLYTLENPFPDPFAPEDPRRGFAALQALLRRFPNVVAWVNGHSHVNRITPVPDPSGQTGGFWEISTAAHVDWPQQARLVEIADNCDGTLSIFGTLIEHAAPPSVELTDPAAATPMQLASLSRELSANDPQVSPGALGSPTDGNVELLLRSPFTVCPPAAATPPPTTAGAPTPSTGANHLPATGTGLADRTVAGAALTAAAAAALALRRRTSPS